MVVAVWVTRMMTLSRIFNRVLKLPMVKVTLNKEMNKVPKSKNKKGRMKVSVKVLSTQNPLVMVVKILIL